MKRFSNRIKDTLASRNWYWWLTDSMKGHYSHTIFGVVFCWPLSSILLMWAGPHKLIASRLSMLCLVPSFCLCIFFILGLLKLPYPFVDYPKSSVRFFKIFIIFFSFSFALTPSCDSKGIRHDCYFETFEGFVFLTLG